MSTFTLKLKDVIKYSGGVLSVENNVSRMIGGDIGLNNYVIFDANYRPFLNGRIIDRYFNREIGMETISMFRLAVRRKMNEIMPYYNQLYVSTTIVYEALSTINIATANDNISAMNSDNTGTSTAESISSADSRSVTSDTPQTMLSGNEDYASAAADANSDSVANSTNQETATQITSSSANSDTLVTGYQGAASDLVMRYRESLINVDLMIIQELEECFMLVWDNGDSYTSSERNFL